uniref:Uncharacterized protein n=1 Tax=Cannabis sativa TaxID=3483 RepID=A0A803Q8F3_CANSA
MIHEKTTMDAALDNVKGRAVWVRWSGMRQDWHRLFGGVKGFRLFRARNYGGSCFSKSSDSMLASWFDKVRFE